jgi:hypothetical protein
VDPIEAFPGVALWKNFAEVCKRAETLRDRTVGEATIERDQVINPVSAEAWIAFDHVKRAASARYDGKVTAAQTKYDREYQNAEAELLRALDRRENTEKWARSRPG